MDDVDITQERVEAELERNVKAAAEKAGAVQIDGPGWCLECEMPIQFSALLDFTPRWCCPECRDAWSRRQWALENRP